jgi:hypothetical protein
MSCDGATGPSADGCVIREIVSVMRDKERKRRAGWEQEQEAAANIER